MLVNIFGSSLFQVVQYEREKLGWGGKSGISLDWVWPVLLHHTSDQRTPGLVILQLHKLLVVDGRKPGKRVPGGKVSYKTCPWKLFFPPDDHNGGEISPGRLNLFLFWRRPQFRRKHLVMLSISNYCICICIWIMSIEQQDNVVIILTCSASAQRFFSLSLTLAVDKTLSHHWYKIVVSY